jgi:hypothetical protein
MRDSVTVNTTGNHEIRNPLHLLTFNLKASLAFVFRMGHLETRNASQLLPCFFSYKTKLFFVCYRRFVHVVYVVYWNALIAWSSRN